MVAIAGGKPMLMGLKEIVSYYAEYQREVVLRRTKFDLAQAKERCHILEGLIIAVRNIDEVIKIIKGADSTPDARDKLRKRFELSERQAQAILDLRLARLTKLEVFKLEEELKQLKELIERLTAIVGSKQLQFDVVKQELTEIKKKYGTPRRSAVVGSAEEPAVERDDILEPGVDSMLVITADKKIKCVDAKNYNVKRPLAASAKKGAVIAKSLSIKSDEVALIFSDHGYCYRLRGQQCMKKLTESGFKLPDLFEDAEDNDVPVALFKADTKDGNLLFITEQGMLKKTAWSEYAIAKTVYQGIRLNDGDRVIEVQPDSEEENTTVFFVTKGGMCLNAKKDDIPMQGRVAGGVKGMNLAEGDKVLFASQIDGEGEIALAISNGRFKRVIAAQIDPLPRYRKGVRIASLSDESIIYADYVTVPYMLAVTTDEGTMSEISTEDIPIDATNTRGRPLKNAKWKAVEVFSMKYREYKE